MRFGASLDPRMDETPASFVDVVDSFGLDHVELRRNYLDTRPDPPALGALDALRADTGVTFTIHAPYNDVNAGNIHETLREAATTSIVETLDMAAAIGAGAVVVHGGSVRRSYPDDVRAYARDQAVRTIRRAAEHAERVGVPLCVENSREKSKTYQFTATPERLAGFLDDVGVAPPHLGVTLDVGHAKASGVDVDAFVDALGDRITVTHLHDNDGANDDHDPLPEYESVAESIGAPYNVLEMKSTADVERCVRD